jgi:hypothetical protein
MEMQVAGAEGVSAAEGRVYTALPVAAASEQTRVTRSGQLESIA